MSDVREAKDRACEGTENTSEQALPKECFPLRFSRLVMVFGIFVLVFPRGEICILGLLNVMCSEGVRGELNPVPLSGSELCRWREQVYMYRACAKSRQVLSPLGMESRKSSLPAGMIKESFTGTQAGFEGWKESADQLSNKLQQRVRWKGYHCIQET